ncbi:MAG TPA: GspH/FimT family pseudopilin [Noviherbaspirillum sp.]
MRARRVRARGFTLLEILVVLVIAGLLLGVVAFNAMPGPRQALQTEAQRIALLLQLARDEAIVRNRAIAFEAGSDSYRFLERDGSSWIPVPQDDLLRERSFSHTPISVSMTPAILNAASNGDAEVRIVFGREPVDRPFVLTLASGDARVAVRADGIGNFTVE